MSKTINAQLVGVQGNNIVVLLPKLVMTKEEALYHAAWLVCLAEENDGQFDEILKAVKNT